MKLGRKKRHKDRIPYCERAKYFNPFATSKNHVCYNCKFSCKLKHGAGTLESGSGFKCPNCQEENSLFYVGLTARPPKKTASKKTWEKFWEKFKNGSHPEGCR